MKRDWLVNHLMKQNSPAVPTMNNEVPFLHPTPDSVYMFRSLSKEDIELNVPLQKQGSPFREGYA